VTDLDVLTEKLIAAWIAWDAAAARIGPTAQAHIARGERPPRLAAHTLEAETRRLIAAERALNMPLGYTARIAALRWHPDGRPHLSVPDAVQAVVHELFPLSCQHKEAS